ncbi:hypothetical protein [Puniceibacterium confluentis]|uniref:hypothetical protein n=1 Tax=Puniceibacterium confluentis TaxID=1958944 RepID=UPI0011B51416|nr:hypothetical protein [Puniceibacterium confluentis]
MEMTKVSEYAHALYGAHGDKAELEAAQRQHEHEAAGDEDQARTWRAIRAAVRQMKGANHS